MNKTKTVYVPMAVDVLHKGHLNIIEVARKLGDVIIGLLSDQAIANYKRLPMIDFDERKKIVENIKGVKSIVIQETYDYESMLRKLKPDFVVHGDDWKTGPQSKMRKKIIELLNGWNGELVEPEYTKGVSSSVLIDELNKNGVTAETRQKSLKKLLKVKPLLRILEAHNGLTGLIVENTNILKNGKKIEFDGIWESSLTDSTSKGKPDTELVDFSSRFSTIEEILEVTSKPIIVDGDTGGRIEHFKFHVKTLDRVGVSAVIIEDKVGNKKNSLFGTKADQKQDDIDKFCNKISEGKNAQVSSDFMIIARIESLILNKGMDDAIKRAKAYIAAGADGIMIHSKQKSGEEIIEFCKKYQEFKSIVPLIVVPSTYHHLSESELRGLGVNIVIYANHLIRSAYPSMISTAKSILTYGRAKEASEQYCMPIKDIISLISESD